MKMVLVFMNGRNVSIDFCSFHSHAAMSKVRSACDLYDGLERNDAAYLQVSHMHLKECYLA